MNTVLWIKRKMKLSKTLALICVVMTFMNCIQFLNVPDITTEVHKDLYLADHRPHLVLGILSANDEFKRRIAVRNTWISTIFQMKEQLSFRITYKFLLDNPTKSSVIESRIFNDILYLNATHHGYANRFGEKMHIWYKYVSKNYPDALLVVRMDDDVFLCVPEMLSRLRDVMSPYLFYGWKSDPYSKVVDEYSFIDDMFVVLGINLINRIADRQYCGYRTCSSKNELVEKHWGSTSVSAWLSIYDDIDTVADNKQIIHFGNTKEDFRKHEELITGNFCKKYILYHKALPVTLFRLHDLTNNHFEFDRNHNEDIDLGRAAPVGALTGNLFTGEIVRSLNSWPVSKINSLVANKSKGVACANWAVLTTIYPPSKSVVNIAAQPKWCLVIVADMKTPDESKYLQNFPDTRRVKYLTVEEQILTYPLLSNSIPLNSLGRKNIGYMYAIHHKAKRIWDFDDDNDGIIDLHDFGMKFNTSALVEPCKGFKNILVNPYPYFGTNETRTWPRGFPLQNIKDQETIPDLCKVRKKLDIGIVQSLANMQPDVDAIYRLTREVPFDFAASTKSHRGFVIPKNTYTPFNAQATLWLPSAFEFMALPISVSGRVTDIWRSYIAEHFLHKRNKRLIFVPPYVIQERNEHTIIRDLNAETDLYEKGRQLVDFLSNLKNKQTLSGVYGDLYTRKYIEISDLNFIRAWESTLAAVKKLK